MSNLSLETEKTKLERKLRKERGADESAEYIQKLEQSSKEELEGRLLELSKTGQGLINTKNADIDLRNLKAQASERSRMHNESIRRNKEHQRYVSLIISDKFGDELMDVQTPQEDQE